MSAAELREQVRRLERAREAARQRGDRAAEARHLGTLGLLCVCLGEPSRASGYFEQCRDLARLLRRPDGRGQRRAQPRAAPRAQGRSAPRRRADAVGRRPEGRLPLPRESPWRELAGAPGQARASGDRPGGERRRVDWAGGRGGSRAPPPRPRPSALPYPPPAALLLSIWRSFGKPPPLAGRVAGAGVRAPRTDGKGLGRAAGSRGGAQGPDRHPRPRRDHRRRPAAGGRRWSAAAPGCGKTLLAMEFLVRGATQFGEPGVFMAFEETRRGARRRTCARSASTSTSWSRRRSSCVDYVHVERSEIEETGEYDLEGLFVRLGHAIDIDRRQARRARHASRRCSRGLPNHAILRAELRRLFRWLKDKGVTAVITGERGDGHADPPRPRGVRLRLRDPARPPRHRPGLDAPPARRQVPRLRARHQRVPVPDRRATASRCCRSPRCGSTTRSPSERVSTGIAGLDAMLGGKGFYRGSSVLVSGTAGTGKTSLAAHFADAACRARRARACYFAFEESPSQIVRNMRSIGLDLRAAGSTQGLLQLPRRAARRSTAWRCTWRRCTSMIERVRARSVVVVDPISNFIDAGTRQRGRGDADAADRLPEGAADHRAVHQPDHRRRARWRRPTSASPR